MRTEVVNWPAGGPAAVLGDCRAFPARPCPDHSCHYGLSQREPRNHEETRPSKAYSRKTPNAAACKRRDHRMHKLLYSKRLRYGIPNLPAGGFPPGTPPPPTRAAGAIGTIRADRRRHSDSGWTV